MMTKYHLKDEVFVNKPIDEVFAFFDKPENLEAMTPPALSFRILTPSPIEMSHGTCIDYVVRILGIPMRWTSLIQNYNPPHQFVDVQLKGPYGFWHHTHTFESVNGGTLIKDQVIYQVPFGLLGVLAHIVFIKWQLNYIFSYRKKKVLSVFK